MTHEHVYTYTIESQKKNFDIYNQPYVFESMDPVFL